MSNFSASISVSLMAAANAALNAAGHGQGNFLVPLYSASVPTFAALHAWGDAVFESAVTAIAGVTVTQGTNPISMTSAAATAKGATWGSDAPLLTGIVNPGLYKDSSGSLWWVIQQYDTATWPDPSAPGLTAIVIKARIPGSIDPWYQTFAADAYKLVNPFTGTGDLCTHNGKTWRVTQGDGSGNNVWEPGGFGWTEVI